MHDWSLMAATWSHWRSQALSWWDRLTGEEWDELDGSREKLLDLLQQKYGWTREEAEQELERRLDSFAGSA